MKEEKYNNSFDRIHCVYVYKLEEFKTCYVGRTKELKKRHSSHCHGKRHRNGLITYDSLYTFCLDNGIPIPEPIVLCNKLTAYESLVKEDFWVLFFKKEGWNVLNKAKTGAKSGSLGHVKMWDYESCKEESKKYETRSQFKGGSYGAYDLCRKNGWLDEFIKKDGKHKNGFWQNKENVLSEAKKYNQISDFIVNSGGAYNAAKKHGWVSEVQGIFQKEGIDEKEICQFYLKVRNIKDVMSTFKIGYKKAKSILIKNNIELNEYKKKK